MSQVPIDFPWLQKSYPHLAGGLLCVAKSSLIVLLTWLLAGVFHRQPALARSRVWRGAFVGGACWELATASLRCRRQVPVRAGAWKDRRAPGDAGVGPEAGSGLGLDFFYDSPASLEIHLNRPVPMTVRVAAPDGNPIAGLRLRVRWLSWPERHGVAEMPELPDNPLDARTDPDGRCVFTDLPAGAQVMLIHPDERYAQFGFGSWITLGERTTADAGTLTLDAAATISGTVRYAGPERVRLPS